MKTCSKCHEEKDESEFYPNKHGKNGLNAQCKSCMKAYNSRYQIEHRRGKHMNKVRIHLPFSMIDELGEIFKSATQCPYIIPDDVEMAIRILLVKVK